MQMIKRPSMRWLENIYIEKAFGVSFSMLTGDISAANRQNSLESRRRHMSHERTSNGWKGLQLQPDEGREYDLSVLG
jgi:hypothetical protein